MLTLLTDLPGSGKTLHTIWAVERLRKGFHADALKADPEARPRAVYYNNVNGVAESLAWTEFADIESWPDIPNGAIIVVDEAQRVFVPKAANSERPRHYTEIDTHRHHGFDVFLITQDAMLVDQRFRAMCERHLHLSRSYGMEYATLYDWKGVQKTTGVKLNNKDGTVSQWKFPSEIYDLYKSAEVHTHKKRLPWRKLATIAATFLVAFVLIGYAMFNFIDRGDAVADAAVGATPDSVGGSFVVAAESVDAWADMSRFAPRVADVPGSALAYSSLAEVVEVPRVRGCSMIQYTRGPSECTCTDQRGNGLDMSFRACQSYIKRGFFDPTAS